MEIVFFLLLALILILAAFSGSLRGSGHTHNVRSSGSHGATWLAVWLVFFIVLGLILLVAGGG